MGQSVEAAISLGARNFTGNVISADILRRAPAIGVESRHGNQPGANVVLRDLCSVEKIGLSGWSFLLSGLELLQVGFQDGAVTARPDAQIEGFRVGQNRVFL